MPEHNQGIISTRKRRIKDSLDQERAGKIAEQVAVVLRQKAWGMAWRDDSVREDNMELRGERLSESPSDLFATAYGLKFASSHGR